MNPLLRQRSPPLLNMTRYLTCTCSCCAYHAHVSRTYPYISARPWPQVGPLFTKQAFILDFAARQVACPGGQTVPLVPGKDAQFPAAACDVCPWRAQCTKATLGQGRSLHIREDAQFQQQLRT